MTVATTCHACNAPLMVRIVERGAAVQVEPVAPARSCEECGDVVCVQCRAADCPHRED